MALFFGGIKMRKPSGILGSMAKSRRQKATNKGTSLIYEAIWGEKPKRSRKKKD